MRDKLVTSFHTCLCTQFHRVIKRGGGQYLDTSLSREEVARAGLEFSSPPASPIDSGPIESQAVQALSLQSAALGEPC